MHKCTCSRSRLVSRWIGAPVEGRQQYAERGTTTTPPKNARSGSRLPVCLITAAVWRSDPARSIAGRRLPE